MPGSEKAHNAYYIVQGTSYIWQRKGIQHILHSGASAGISPGKGKIICIVCTLVVPYGGSTYRATSYFISVQLGHHWRPRKRQTLQYITLRGLS